ncbi:MAG: HAD family phosphatase [Erysipelotrichales bacterium]|nr:HAD family phosphatase [Erysipelotrichales bacterium]
MNKYLIALDMDGTLLNDKKEICPKTKEYLKKLQKDGHIIVIASGRPIRAIKKYYDELELTSPIVCYNGANIIVPNSPDFKEICFSFPKEIVKEIYSDLKDKYIDNVMCETNEKLWLVQDDEILGEFFWLDDMELIKGDLHQNLDENPMTMIIRSISTDYNDEIRNAIKKHKDLSLRFWGGVYNSYSEIYFNYVSKASGLEYIAKLFNIPTQNIIAFGDAQNDIEMFNLSGISVAMQNADDDTKKHAKIISEFDNNHDGIVYVLKQIIK